MTPANIESTVAGIPNRSLLKYDLAGQTFGRWTVAEKAGPKWKCVCSCGETKQIASGDLRAGKSKSCGCLQRELQAAKMTKHGMVGSKVHRTWKAMWTRCTNPNTRSFQAYQHRKPPTEWRDFSNFYADLGDAPSDNHSIERINNSLPYSKENCRWALPPEQSRNTTRNRVYTFRGETKCLVDWANSEGMDRSTLLSRLDSGMTFEQAIVKPVRNLSKGNR